MRQTGRQESRRSVSDARGRRQRRATDGKGGWSLQFQPQPDNQQSLENPSRIVSLSFSSWSRVRDGVIQFRNGMYVTMYRQ